MEDRLSKNLYNLNKEYLELKKEYDDRKLKKILKGINLIKQKQFRYLLNIYIEKRKTNKISNYISEQEESNFELTERIAVYTCIIGKYDKVIEPVYVSDKCDYYIITDQDIDDNSIWKKIDINTIKIVGLKNNELNRYVKLHPHIFFENYNYSIYLDGNVRIISDLIPMVESLGNKIIGLHIHSFRNCAYQEGKSFKFNKRLKSFYPDVTRQLNVYYKEGFPHSFGLFENTIIVRKHMDKKCIELMNEWWKQLNEFSFRDQISLPYTIWKMDMKQSIHTYGILNKNYRIRLCGHRS